MKKLVIKLLFLFVLSEILLIGVQLNGQSIKYKSEPGPFKIQTKLVEWVDKSRDREIPVKIYSPVTETGSFPIIIFSHGLGGSREGGKAWGEHWTSNGYISVHIQHPGSDVDILKNLNGTREERFKQFAKEGNVKNFIDRALDVKFVIDEIIKMNQHDSFFKHKFDIDHIGMSGHSFGAGITLAVAGQIFVIGFGIEKSYIDNRIKAAIAFSPPIGNKNADKKKVYSKINIPVFILTGTEDDSPINDTKAADRRIPFDNMNGSEKYLVTFIGGDHMVFSGQKRLRGDGKHDEFIKEQIRMCTTAFWDAYLKNDPNAKSWLLDDYEKVLENGGIFEKK